MKRLIQILVLMISSAIVTGCASTKAYVVDRGRDALDIVNMGVEWGGLGASAEVGPWMTGLIASGGDGYGMVGRDIGKYEFLDWQAVLFGMKSIESKASNKSGPSGFSTTQFMFLPGKGNFLMEKRNVENYLGYCELHITCGLGVRCGINVFAIPEFILGFFGIDLGDDDVETKALNKTRNTPPQDSDHRHADGNANTAIAHGKTDTYFGGYGDTNTQWTGYSVDLTAHGLTNWGAYTLVSRGKVGVAAATFFSTGPNTWSAVFDEHAFTTNSSCYGLAKHDLRISGTKEGKFITLQDGAVEIRLVSIPPNRLHLIINGQVPVMFSPNTPYATPQP